jgi:hypothetical protein
LLTDLWRIDEPHHREAVTTAKFAAWHSKENSDGDPQNTDPGLPLV